MTRTCSKEGCNNRYDPFRNRYSKPGKGLEFNIAYQKRCKDSDLCEDCLAKEVEIELTQGS